MTIKEIQKTYQNDASLLGDYQSMTKTELANGYVAARHAAWNAKAEGNVQEEMCQEQLRSSYHSALMLRYWYKIWEWRENSKSLNLDETDFVEWLQDGLWVSFYYETWCFEYEAIVKDGVFIDWKYDDNGQKIPNKYYWKLDPNAPDKIINRCCASIRGKYYQYHNKDKRKADVHTYSLDNLIEEDGDYAVQWTGCIVEPKHDFEDPTYLLVNAFHKRNELLESLIIDGIVNGDSFKEITTFNKEEIWDDDLKEYVEQELERTHSEFDPRKLVKHLSHLDENYIFNFCYTYGLPKEVGTMIYDKLKKTPNQKLYKLIQKVQLEVAEDKSLREMLR